MVFSKFKIQIWAGGWKFHRVQWPWPSANERPPFQLLTNKRSKGPGIAAGSILISESESGVRLLPCLGHNSDLRDIREYTNCFLICGVRRIIADNARSFYTPSFYQIKPPVTPPCRNLRTPHLFQNVLMKVSQIWVVRRGPQIRYHAQVWDTKKLPGFLFIFKWRSSINNQPLFALSLSLLYLVLLFCGLLWYWQHCMLVVTVCLRGSIKTKWVCIPVRSQP